MKGINPLIATVLLIAFTVAIAGIVSIWATSFTSTSIKITENQSLQRLNCAYGSIALSDVNFCSTRNELSGRLTNTGLIDLSEITLQQVYSNGTSPTQPLCLSGSSVVECSTSNLTIKSGFLYAFNVSGISSGYDIINLITHCPGVTDLTKTFTTNC